jgi:O-antigen ligase
VLSVCAFRLDWGVLFLLATTLFLRVGFSTGTQSPISLSLALTGALTTVWVVRMLIEDKRIRLLPSPVNRPLLAFVGIVFLSYIWSNIVRDPLVVVWDSFPKVQLGALGTMILSPAATLLVANHLKTTKHLKILAGFFVTAAGIGLLKTLSGVNLPFLNTSGLFPLWVIMLTAGQALFNNSLSGRVRIGLGLAAVALFAYQFGQGISWTSGWFPPLAGTFVLMALRSRRLLIGLAIAVAIFVMVRSDYLASVFQAEETGSGITRLSAWEVNWRITRDHLLLGTGPAGYAVYYTTYVPDSAMATHNNYIDVLSETGLVGLLMFVWLLVSVGQAAGRVVRRVPRGGFEHGLAASLLAGFVGLIVAMGLGDWFIPFAFTQGIAGYDYTVWGWMMIGAIMLLYHRYVATSSSAVPLTTVTPR